ncbi:MAG: dihydrolipoamide acetyltransferase family protein [Sphingomonadaceae bacterium]
MGIYLFRLPDIGEGVTEAEITAWYVKPGDRVEEDQSLVDVMTSKATMDLTSPVAGIVTTIHGEVGQKLPVGATLVELEIDGADHAGATEEAVPPHPLAAPATRRRARDMGIALEDVAGTGPEGRVLPQDLDALAAAAPAGPGIMEVPVIGLRRQIAEKLERTSHIPHFTYVEECDLTELEALRAELNDSAPDQPHLTLLPFFIRALVKLLPAFPQLNARFDDKSGILRMSDAVHVGIATQTPSGLLVPVLRHAETRDLRATAAELKRITTAARDGHAPADLLSGSTITLTSLGLLGGIAATPILNAPEVAIIGPNRLIERAVVHGGSIRVRQMMNISASFDHRIVDGHDAAHFIRKLKRLLEHPALMFIAE